MHTHLYGGWAVCAPLPLRGLPLSAKLADPRDALAVHLAELPQPQGEAVFAWPGRYRLALHHDGGSWLFSAASGARIRVHADGQVASLHAPAGLRPPEPGTSDEAIDVLVRRVLPRMAILRGRLAVHAAALAHPDQDTCIMLTGSTHSGKSTWTAAALQAGWRLISDDISVVDMPPGGPACMSPSASGVCVWPDTRQALNLPLEDCLLMAGYEGKLHYQPKTEPWSQARPLSAIVELHQGTADSAMRLEPVRAPEAVAMLGRQLIRFNPAAGAPQEMSRQLPRLAHLASQVPAWRLHYPARYEALHVGLATLRALR